MSVGMKPSKKYELGSIHENGTGRFKILDRFLDNNIIHLKYEWLTGEFTGKIDVNKESNVNASIWKFKNVRGLLPSQQQEATVVEERLEEALEELKSQKEMILVLQGQMAEMLKIGIHNNEMLKKVASDNAIVQKLLDKI